MFNYLNGEVTVINPKYIVVDINGIGYELYVANPYSFELNKKQLVYVYQHVKEDEVTLYGFQKNEERELFFDLISVKGIGPKTALLILAATTITEFQSAIKREDIVYLTKFPKVGKKSAQQMIIDLESKYKKIEIGEFQSSNNTSEVEEALQALGYNNTMIKKVIGKIDNSLSIEEKIKECLKLLIKI